MPVADSRVTNTLYPIPETFKDHSVSQLLTAAAYGRIGVDKRLIQTILDRGEAAVPEVVQFADEPFAEENTANLTRWLFLLLRHYRTPTALPFMMALVKANIEELPEELMEAVLEIGSPAVEEMIKLYDEIDEDDLRGELAFMLASFRNRDPRILSRLLDHFEYDAADGAIILESFGDPAAIPAIEKIIAEPGLPEEMRAELASAVERMREDPSQPVEEPPPFDLMDELEDAAEPVYEILTDYEWMAMLSSPSGEYRAGAVVNLTSRDLTPKVVERVHQLALTDPSPGIRGRAWEALAGDPDDKALIAEMTAVLEDAGKPVEERTGTLVALASLNKYSRIKEALLDFYHSFPDQRSRVLKAMWRTLDKAWGKYMVDGLASTVHETREQAILGIGNLGLSSEADKLEALFEDEDLRPVALYAYALSSPGVTSRVRMKPLFALIEKLAKGFDEEEAEIVRAALDERLAIRDLKPVFYVAESGHDHADHDHAPAETLPKVGRNDPCPCGSGKKYKKCHGQ